MKSDCEHEPQTSSRTKWVNVLPQSGIQTSRGHPFHHDCSFPLQKLHYERLEEHGIVISKKAFNQEEDDIIRKNWQSYALTYDLPDSKAAYIAGFDVGRYLRNVTERALLIKKTMFYPKMCEGLIHRTAQQVGCRIQFLYDPVKLDGAHETAFTDADDVALLQLFAEHKSYIQVAKAMKRPFVHVKSRIQYFKRQAKRGEAALNPAIWALLSKNCKKEISAAQLPEEGILNEDGHLFHHVLPRLLYKRHIQRLLEHNIVLASGKFSEEEDAQIDQNWLEFAKEHRLPVKSAGWFAGYGAKTKGSISDLLSEVGLEDGTEFGEATYSKDANLRTERLMFVWNSNFWPLICRGLYSRTAFSVRMRLLRNYDPARFLEGANADWSEEDDRKLMHLFSIYKSFPQVSMFMRRPFIELWARVQRIRRRSIALRSPELSQFWSHFDRMLRGKGEKRLKKSVKKGKEPDVDWNMLAESVYRTEDVVREAWDLIVEDIKEKLAEGITWDQAFKEAIPPPLYITCYQFAAFIDIIIQRFSKYEILPRRLHPEERAAIEEEMFSSGLSGFYSGRYTELQYCILRLRLIVHRVTKRLINVLDFPISQWDLCRVISLSYRSMEHATSGTRQMPLKTAVLVQCLLRFMHKHHPDWKPPRKLIRYAEKEQIEIMFPETEQDVYEETMYQNTEL